MKKYKKSSEILGYNLVKYGAVMAGVLVISGCVVSSGIIDPKPVEPIEIATTITKDPVVLTLDTNVEENHRTLFVETDIDQVKKELANIQPIDFTGIEDEDLKQEMIDDNISIYLDALQMVGDYNIIPSEKMENYIMDNYDILNDANMQHFTDDKVIIYNASAYKRLMDNNIDIYDALNEFNTLMALQAYPTDLTEEEYYALFPNLLKTIDLEKHENVYDIYYPLAYYIHRISCDAKIHSYEEYSAVHCENIEEDYQKLMK